MEHIFIRFTCTVDLITWKGVIAFLSKYILAKILAIKNVPNMAAEVLSRAMNDESLFLCRDIDFNIVLFNAVYVVWKIEYSYFYCCSSLCRCYYIFQHE